MMYLDVSYDENDLGGTACAPEEITFDLLPIEGIVDSWQEFTFQLEDGDYTDYLANDLGWRMCSKPLRDLIESRKATEDLLQWLPAIVSDGLGTAVRYYVLHFPVIYDVLDTERTLFAEGGSVIRPILSKSKLGSHRVFAPMRSRVDLVITGNIKEEIILARLTGMDFSKLSVA
jgi:hypothetical protein